MKDGKKLVYSGDSLRRFLHRKGLTYKDAAKELGLDKNTIGKAVRGGNMNINVLLSIANHWNFPITDFFIFVNQEEFPPIKPQFLLRSLFVSLSLRRPRFATCHRAPLFHRRLLHFLYTRLSMSHRSL